MLAHDDVTSGGLVGGAVLRPDEDDGPCGLGDHVLADGAEQEPEDGPVPTGAEHQHLGPRRGLGEGVRRTALHHVDGEVQLRMPFGDAPRGLVHALAHPLVVGLPARGPERLVRDQLPGVHQPQREATAYGLPGRPGQRRVTFGRSVHPCRDRARHTVASGS